MALEKSGEIVKAAFDNNYSIAAINVYNYESTKLAIQKAEELQKPLLIAFYPGWKGFIDIDVAAEIVKACAKKVKVPIGLHLDHCTDLDEIKLAIDSGYSSVMYDGSVLPFDENVKNTLEVVKIAKPMGIDVEAELGHVGQAVNVEDFEDSAKFTSPGDAIKFVERTGCSSLAVAVGNAHGNYARLPNLDIGRISDIKNAINIPLVLHGGSGIPDAQLQAAVKAGIAKVNVATEYNNTYYKAIMDYDKLDGKAKEMYFCSCDIRDEVLTFLDYKIRLLNPA